MTVLQLTLARHGESEANQAASRAEASGALRVDVPARDADVALSDLGRRQAADLGARLGREPAPDAIWVSSYRRARETTAIALEAAGSGLAPVVDERLRDRELGVLDTLTGRGVRELHPDEAARRAFLGKYYYRPPGGESWTDVGLRVRAVLAELDATGAERVLIVSHDAVTWLIRAVCERIEERDLLAMAAANPIPNASLTRLERTAAGSPWRPVLVNDVAHLEEVTEHAGEPDAAR